MPLRSTVRASGEVRCIEPWLDTAHAFARDPSFSRALTELGNRLLAAYAVRGWRGVALAEHRRYGVAALLLHFDHHRARGGPPPTQASIVALAATAALGTRRGIQGVIATFVHAGFIEAVPMASDGRARQLLPLPPLIKLFHDALAARIAALRLLRRDACNLPDDLRGFLPAYVDQLVVPLLERAEQPAGLFPELAPFAERRTGYLILFALLAQGHSPGVPFPIHVDRLSRILSVSPTQIRKVLLAAQHMGLITVRRGGMIVWLPSPMERLRFFAALELARTWAVVGPSVRT